MLAQVRTGLPFSRWPPGGVNGELWTPLLLSLTTTLNTGSYMVVFEPSGPIRAAEMPGHSLVKGEGPLGTTIRDDLTSRA